MITREAKAGCFIFIVLDPLYKLLGEREENATHHMTAIMNTVESVAVDTEAAVAFGGHYSKGNQAEKDMLDRISGSGVFARDPDSIVTMTAHEQSGAFSVEMTLRNFAPQEPFVVRREHPLMAIDKNLDPAKLKKPKGRESIYKADDVLKCLEGSMTDTDGKDFALNVVYPEQLTIASRTNCSAGVRVFQSAIDEKWSRKP
jgi:hypothetical protein